MFSFLFSHIQSHTLRSISLSFLSFIFLGVILILIFLYQNIVSALGYYSYDIVDEHRFTLRSDTNILTIFSKDTPGLPPILLDILHSDNRVENIQAFTLVELPVLAKFSLFQFGLDIDMPIFAVSDGYLTGSEVPIGMPRAMIDFYNIQFAGSSTMFPKISESFLLGQTIDLTFGASKVFPSLPRTASPITGKIVRVSDDFPGFGIIIPESIVRAKMQETGYSLGNPYKIVGYMKNATDRNVIETTYRTYNPQFDADTIREFQSKISFLRQVFFGIFLFFAVILSVFFLLLLFAFFRERRDVFLMISVFGLSGIRARLMTLAEPILLIFSGVFIGSFGMYFLIDWLENFVSLHLLSRGILFPILSLDIAKILLISLSFFLIFSTVVILIESRWRKKILLR